MIMTISAIVVGDYEGGMVVEKGFLSAGPAPAAIASAPHVLVDKNVRGIYRAILLLLTGLAVLTMPMTGIAQLLIA
ncbi:MAG: hypothetical protein ACP5RJ_08225 [Conexivisphaera sp.]